MGGNTTITLALDAGLVDALTLHLTPVVPGAGTPLLTGSAPAHTGAPERDHDIDGDAP